MGFAGWIKRRHASALLLLTAATCAIAAPAPDDSTAPAGSARACGLRAPLPLAWTAPERWAWGQICQSRPAHFDALLGTRKDSGRQTPDRFGDPRRVLSAGFLRAVLVQEPFRSAVPPEGIRVVGATFDGDVDLPDAVFVRFLGIFDSKVSGKSVLSRLRTPATIAFIRSTFEDDFSLASASIGGSLNMTDSTFGDVAVKTAEIAGAVSMNGSRVIGRLDMNGVTIGGSLHLSNATFGEVDLIAATVGQQLNAGGSTFNQTLHMSGLSAGGALLMHRGSTFADVGLGNARVGGQFNVSDAVFRGELDAAGMSIEQDLLMNGARFEGAVELPRVRVAGDMDLAGAVLADLNLYGATVGKDLYLAAPGGPNVQWRAHAARGTPAHRPVLNLLDTSVGGLIDQPGSWPANLQFVLRDFRYERLLPFADTGERAGELRDAAWYVDWLARDRPYSFQPYWQLAKTLEAYGEHGKAHKVLIAGRERQRLLLPWWSPERWGLWALRWVIGYGYGAGELQALVFAIPFFVVGGFLARCRAKPVADGKRPGFWYSFDMLLPGMWLDERHAKIVLSGGARWYFNVHRLAGYVLVLFVVAGLAGLAG